MVGCRYVKKSMLLFCRNLENFQILMYSKSSQCFKSNSTHNLPHGVCFTLYRLIMCVFHCQRRGPLRLLRSSASINVNVDQTIPIITVGLRWNGHYCKVFALFFHWQIWHSKLWQTGGIFQFYIHCCLCGNEQFSYEICHLVYPEQVSKSY